MRRGTIAMFAAVIACAGAAFAAGAAVKVDIAAPWTPVTPPATGRADRTDLREWILPNGRAHQGTADSQYLLLVRETLPDGGLGAYISDFEAGVDQDRQAADRTYVPLDDCPRRAWYFTYAAPLAGVPRKFEIAFVATDADVYRLEYFRPATQPEDAAAHAAVVTFCKWQSPL